MKRAIGYSYFNCVKEIPRGLDDVAPHFDYVICVDGRYINYEDPLGRDYSEDGSTELLKKRYPNAIFDKVKPMFQTDKRQRYLDIAGELKCDWLMVWDSDDILYPDPKYQNWKKLFKNMDKYSERFPAYKIFKMKAWIPSKIDWARAYNMVEENIWNPYIRLHRDPGQQRYCLYCHYWFAPRDATDEDLIKQRRNLYIADHTLEGVRFTTNSALRGETQLFARDRWAWDNDCEEKRRLYFAECDYHYGYPHDPPNGYWRYNEIGKPIFKICNEDGTKV